MAWVERAVWYAPRDSAARLLAARAMLQLNMNLAAQQHLAVAEELDHDLAELTPLRIVAAAQSGDVAAGEQLMNWDQTSSLPLEAYEALVRSAQYNNDLRRADLVLDEVAQVGAAPMMVNYQRGRNLELSDHLEEAVQRYEQALTEQPAMVRAAFRAGICYYKLREFPLAEAKFRQALIPPYDVIAKIEIANCLWEQNRLEEATAMIAPSLSVPPQALPTLYLQVDEYVDTNRAALVAARIADASNDSQRAIELLEQALAFNSREFEARALLIKNLRLSGRTAEAEAVAKVQSEMVANRQRLQKLRLQLGDEPNNIDLLCEMAELLWLTESDAESRLVIEQIFAIDRSCERATKLLDKITMTPNGPAR